MTALARVAALAGACSLLWVIEGRRPFIASGEDRARRVRPNLVLAGLTVLTNVAFATVLPPSGSRLNLDWPFWLQALAAVVILDFFAWVAHVVLHKTSWGWRTHRVHHSDVAVDVTTALRQHPGETIWRLAWRLVPIWILGIPLPFVAVHETLSAANARTRIRDTTEFHLFTDHALGGRAYHPQFALPAWRALAGPVTFGQGRKPAEPGARTARAFTGWRRSGPMATSRSPCW